MTHEPVDPFTLRAVDTAQYLSESAVAEQVSRGANSYGELIDSSRTGDSTNTQMQSARLKAFSFRLHFKHGFAILTWVGISK